jgi:phosphoglucomutase
MNYQLKYQQWLNLDTFDDETKNELRMIEKNPIEIEDRFYKDL